MMTLIGIFILIAVVATVMGEFGKDAEKKKQEAKDKEQAELLRRIADAAEQKNNPPSTDPGR